MPPKVITPVEVRPLSQRIALDHHLLSLGSCFAATVGERLRECRLHCLPGPTGILYNPASIASLLRRLLAGREYVGTDLRQHEGLWLSLEHQGAWSHPDREVALERMNRDLVAGVEQLRRCDWLLLTFGTAYGWQIDTPEGPLVVANCHRLPVETFARRLIPAAEIVADWRKLILQLRELRPELQVLLTLSPVRHLRGEPAENSLSKAHLRVAAGDLVESCPGVHYFPACEVLLDELRDYRYYAQDLIHPSDTAEEIIWERFRTACLDERAQEYTERYGALLAARRHRPRHPGTPAARAWEERVDRERRDILSAYPEVPGDAQGS